MKWSKEKTMVVTGSRVVTMVTLYPLDPIINEVVSGASVLDRKRVVEELLEEGETTFWVNRTFSLNDISVTSLITHPWSDLIPNLSLDTRISRWESTISLPSLLLSFFLYISSVFSSPSFWELFFLSLVFSRLPGLSLPIKPITLCFLFLPFSLPFFLSLLPLLC